MYSNDYAQAPSISTNLITNHSETTRFKGSSEYHVQPPSRSELLHHAWNSITSGYSERLITTTNPAPDAEGRVNKSEVAYSQSPKESEVVQPVSRSELLHHALNSIISEDGERLMATTNPTPDFEGRVNTSEIAYKQGPTQSEVVEVENKNVVKSENNCKIKSVEIDNKPGPTQSEVVDLENKNVVKSKHNCKIKVVENEYKQGLTQSETVVNQLNNSSPGGFVISKFEAAEVVDENNKSKKIGVLSRIWKAVFGLRGDDFEKRLQYLRKKEVLLLTG